MQANYTTQQNEEHNEIVSRLRDTARMLDSRLATAEERGDGRRAAYLAGELERVTAQIAVLEQVKEVNQVS